MALHGSLKELRLGDVLQTVLSAGGRGLLRVRNAGRRAILHLGERGMRLLEPEVLDDRMILEAFVRRGAVAPEVLARAQKIAETGRQSALETLLIGGSIDRGSFDALLAEAAEDGMLEVFAWTDGDFRFEEGAEPPSAKGRVAEVALDPHGLLLRAAQRIDDQRAIADRMGSHAVLVIASGERGGACNDAIEAPAPKVLARLDGERLLDEIAVEEGLPFFETRKAAASLVAAGAARLPTADELAQRARSREERGDLRAAFALLRQWQGQSPQDDAPYEASVGLASRSGRLDDESDALRALGRVGIETSRPEAARLAFERLLVKRPGDRDALEGLRDAARALGDAEGFAKTTQALAADALGAGDAGRAASLLHELLEANPTDVQTRVLRTKALVRLGDRAQAIEEFERIAEALPKRCKRRSERDLATYCGDTLSRLAPDRSDLLRRFRSMLEAPTSVRRRVLIVAALLVVVSGAGLVFWPRPAARLLAKANAAAARGDAPTVMATIDELERRYPEAPELDDALALRRRFTLSKTSSDSHTDAGAPAAAREAAAWVRDSLADWPAADAVSKADTLATRLRALGQNSAPLRGEIAAMLRLKFADAVSALRREAVSRRDALDAAQAASERPPTTEIAARAVLERARAALDPKWAPLARHAVDVARKLVSILGTAWAGSQTDDDLRFLETDVDAASRAVTSRAGDVIRLAREHHRLRIEETSERARTEGDRQLARGDLDAAEACFRDLAELISAVEKDADLRPLLEPIERRGYVELSRSRSAMVARIREGLAAGAEAERTGNLRGAASQYARLVRQFPEVRFDSVFTVPLRITTVPPLASVTLNGRPVARSDNGGTIVRYGWGAPATVSVQSPGYEPASVVLETSAERPEAEIKVRLAPARRWAVPLPGTVEAPLLGIDGGVIVCSRSGRVERLGKDDGTTMWSVETRCVEGVRGRPVASGDTLWVPLLDGRVARISLATGGALPPLQLRERPIGDAAALPGHVAFAIDDALAVFTDGEKPSYVALPSTPTAGVLSALGAFWVGDAKGDVTRVDGTSLVARTVRPGGHVAVIGLAADAEKVYALAEDGTLYAVGGSGSNEIAWTRQGLGDVVGRPAPAPGGVVAVADRSGRVQFLSSKDGTPRSVREMGASPRGGVIAMGDRIVAALSDGRMWVYSVSADSAVVDAPLEGTSRLAPADLGDGSVALPAAGNGVAVVPLPK
jgi:tetratricopeptide (TPR) repeat protein/outer membrane protein assembly factor BamB